MGPFKFTLPTLNWGPYAALAVVSFLVGFGAAWKLQSGRIDDAKKHEQLAVAALIKEHEAYQSELVAAGERLRAAQAFQSMQVESDLQERIRELQNRIDSTPPRIIRVRVCDEKAMYAGRDGGSGSTPAFGDGASPLGRGVGRDAGGRSEIIELDLSGLDDLVGQAKLVSERLRACQRRLLQMSPR
jgi:hypothetical protein